MSHRFGPRISVRGAGMWSRVAQWNQRSLIKSIQRGIITMTSGVTTDTATITAVVPDHCRLIYLGAIDPADVTVDISACRIALTNSTTITATVNSTSAGGSRVVSYEIQEFWPGVLRSVQRGTLSTAAAASGTATITSVNTTHATVDALGFTTTATATEVGTNQFSLVLTNATTITGTGLGSLTRTAGYQVIEWY